MGINDSAPSTQAEEFPLESVANVTLDAKLKHVKKASTPPSSYSLCRDSRCGNGMLAHNLPQTKSKRTEQKNTWQREPALDLPAKPETTMDDSTSLLNGHQFVPEPTIQNREPGYWIEIYELSVTNDEPHNLVLTLTTLSTHFSAKIFGRYQMKCWNHILHASWIPYLTHPQTSPPI